MVKTLETIWEEYPPADSAHQHTVAGNVWRTRDVGWPAQVATPVAAPIAARDLYVYLPPSYTGSRKRYPVLYLQDGQNVFDEATSYVGEWGADEAAEDLARQGLECVLVAIPNGGKARMREYGPWARGVGRGTSNSGGELYLDYVTQVVKPLIDANFRTKSAAPFTGIGGSSMGGLISLYAALTRPKVFGFCMAMSPSIWFGSSRLFELARATPVNKTRFYLDMGLRETPDEKPSGMLMDAREMFALLHKKKFDVAYIEDADGIHHESSWRRRFPAALTWFLKPKARPEPPQAKE